jgi:hypothetical protein
MPETEVALDLFMHWLTHAHERRFVVAERSETGATTTEGDARLAIEVRPLLPVEDAVWVRRREQLEAALSEGLPGRYALWVPSGADVPGEEPALSHFVDLVRKSAVRLGPRERSYVPIPITLRLRKVSDEGGVVTASGGLNSYWARFTEHVKGTYDLDSRQLHRLPESEEHLQELLDLIVEGSKEMAPGDLMEVESMDAWTVQRLEGKDGVTVIGTPPGNPEDHGLAVRRNFRRLLAEAGTKLRETAPSTGSGQALRALVVVGYYARMEAEGASTAMRGYDPGLYGGIDFVCLAADGLIKPLIQPAGPRKT